MADASFNEFHLILCRNVMIYFNEALQQRVFALLHASLVPLGFLGIGRRERLRWSDQADAYEEVAPSQRLYRRIR